MLNLKYIAQNTQRYYPSSDSETLIPKEKVNVAGRLMQHK